METGPERGAVPPAGQGCGGRARRPRRAEGQRNIWQMETAKPVKRQRAFSETGGTASTRKLSRRVRRPSGRPAGPWPRAPPRPPAGPAPDTAPRPRRLGAGARPPAARGAWGRLPAGRTPGSAPGGLSAPRRTASARCASHHLGSRPAGAGFTARKGLRGRPGPPPARAPRPANTDRPPPRPGPQRGPGAQA